jgi:glycine/D-amino acid oxidase-like deaminating enzyme
MTNDIHIGIVGGGITGVSTAYFLAEKGFNPYIIEAGKLGKGDDDKISGSYPPPEPKHYLMITTPYDSSLKLFLKENGNGKAEKYFELSNAGCYLMKSIAKEIDGNIVKELGSLYVGSKRRKKNLEEELKGYREMGYGEDFVRFWSKEKISELYGTDKFYGGLFFPRDAIMDGRRYLIGMLSKYKERINVVEDAELTRVEEIEDGVKIEIKYKDGKN